MDQDDANGNRNETRQGSTPFNMTAVRATGIWSDIRGNKLGVQWNLHPGGSVVVWTSLDR